MWWKNLVTDLKGIGPKKAADLANMQIFTIGDLLEYYPRQSSYIDYSRLKNIAELDTDGTRQIFKAVVYRVRDGIGAHGRRYTVVTVRDETGYANAYFFMGQRYGAKKLKPETQVLVTGKVKSGRTAKVVGEASIQELRAGEAETLGILPVYSLSGSLTQNNMRQWVKTALSFAEKELPESLPANIISQCHLPSRLEALKNIHFPSSWQSLQEAKRRFIFEELFLLQCGLLYYRHQHQEERAGIRHGADGELIHEVIENLPFKLTEAQKQAWSEIAADMELEKPMHRILQGDVGSGKTVISALALAKAKENGFQGCLMAPTEILAVQHYNTLIDYLEPLGVRVGLLTGGMRAKARRNLLMELELGMIDIVVGTHALIQEDVRFNNLSVVITDEQHRFGVEQRAKLANKSANAPDVLVMTATPIPRTLALTVYGDLDVSQMKGKPVGRKPVQTLCYTEEKRSAVYEGVVRQVQSGHQVYVVCPLIEQSEGMEANSAESVYEELYNGVLHNIPCALLHGRLKGAEKEAIMEAFSKGEIKVLVTTTVIEVGVNVPNATLMIIENAERFGLAQLHQLRGRVGRGSAQSFCVLIAGNDAPDTLARLQVLRDSEDGFYLAEKDLELRGVGQLFGLRQHGLPDLRIADIIRDTDVIIKARNLAMAQLKKQQDWQQLRALVDMQFGERFRMIFNT